MKKLLFPLVSVLLVALVAAQDTTYNLVWKPKSGQQLNYKMKVEAKVETATLVFATDLILKVLAVESNGDYTLETGFKNGKISVLGQEEAIPDEKPEVQKYNAKGDLIGEKPSANEDPFAELLGQVTDLKDPGKAIKVGDKWSHVIKENKQAKLPPAQVDYELTEVTQKDGAAILKIAYKFRQTDTGTPVTADGFYLINAEDGSLVQVQTYMENVVIEAELPPTSAKLSMIRE